MSQDFKTTGIYATTGKWPWIVFADQSQASDNVSYGYVNNSLEGALFTAQDSYGAVLNPGKSSFLPNWNFFTSNPNNYGIHVTSAVISSGVCTLTLDEDPTATGIDWAVGDLVSLNGFGWSTAPTVPTASSHIPNINGVWSISAITTTTLSFEITAADRAAWDPRTIPAVPNEAPVVLSGYVFSIYDNRTIYSSTGKSYTSVIFTPSPVYNVGIGYRRVLPSDLYTRFRIQSGSELTPQGGINSNLFNVLANDGLTNIKPVLWAYFFGYNNPSTLPLSHFEIAFNSYAIVLRPSGSGSNLEFAIVKFNWGTDAGVWANVLDTDYFKQHTVENTDLGYLISSNPSVGTNKVTELAKSDSFTYDSAFPVKLNLKISIRKHLLSDSILDGTYVVNLMVSDNYDVFGEGTHYDSILHAYIEKPVNDATDTGPYLITTGVQPHDSMLMPMMYFKFVNINEQYIGPEAPFATPPSPGSSKIVQDNLYFKQINAVEINTIAHTSYLY